MYGFGVSSPVRRNYISHVESRCGGNLYVWLVTSPGGGGGGGGGYSDFFFIRRLGPSIYRSPPKNIWNFKHPQKIFEILATQKISPFCTFTLRKDPKLHRNYPKYSPILWWPPKKIHKIFTPQKIFIFWKSKKILKFKILNPKKWSEPTYVWKFLSTPPGLHDLLLHSLMEVVHNHATSNLAIYSNETSQDELSDT